MSKHDFPDQEFLDRQRRARSAIAEAGLDLLIVIHPTCLHWLIGTDTKSYQSFQCLFVSAEPQPLVMLTRESERNEYLEDSLADEVRTWQSSDPEDPIDVFAALVREKGYLEGRIGLEVPAYYLHAKDYLRLRDVLGDALVGEHTWLIHDLKLVKSRRELEYIQQAQRIADVVMGRALGAIAPGVSELDAAAEVYHALLSNQSGLPASPINLVSGDRTCFSHGAPTEKLFDRGDYCHIEFGAAYRRYTATIGRQLCLGKPTPRMRELYDIVRAACDACISQIKAGVPAVRPHEAAKAVIEGKGLEAARIHTTGYGIAPGFPPSWGEPVNLNAGNEYILEAGMVLSVEPPVMIHEERLGARIIDNVLVTDNGCEILSDTPRELIIV